MSLNAVIGTANDFGAAVARLDALRLRACESATMRRHESEMDAADVWEERVQNEMTRIERDDEALADALWRADDEWKERYPGAPPIERIMLALYRAGQLEEHFRNLALGQLRREAERRVDSASMREE